MFLLRYSEYSIHTRRFLRALCGHDETPGLLPHFLCIGAQKAGTTWLYNNLKCNDSVWLPPIKELHFFDYIFGMRGAGAERRSQWKKFREKRLAKNMRRLLQRKTDPDFADYIRRLDNERFFTESWYLSMFNGPCAREKIRGEITPQYSTLPERGIRYLRAFLGNIKIIYIIRDPLARALSHLAMMAKNTHGTVIPSESDWMRLAENPAIQDRGNYKLHIPRWDACFPENNLLYLPFGLIGREPDLCITTVENFLGAKPMDASLLIREEINKSKKYAIPQRCIDYLAETTREQRLFLGHRFSREFCELTR